MGTHIFCCLCSLLGGLLKMRTAATLFALFALAIATAAGGYAPTPLNLKNRLQDKSWSAGRSELVGVGASVTACSAVLSCADCNTVSICRPTTTGWEPIQNITCPSDQPYCDYSTGSCTTVPSATCGQADNFICLENGHFPDTNCSNYHVCEGYQAHKFTCSIEGERYNADTQTCEAVGCSDFVCSEKGQKVPNSLFKSYYAYCNSSAEPSYIQKCPGTYQLNVTSQNCEPICQEEGVLQDVQDCTKYYKCQYIYIDEVNKFLIRELLDCPANTGFDPNNYICISLTEYPDCKQELENKRLAGNRSGN